MVKNLLFAAAGLAFTLYFWIIQPELPFRYAALALPNIWLAASLFYAIPLVVSYLVARFCCRWREGAWWVVGSSVALLGLLPQCWDSHLWLPLFSSCGTSTPFWLAATAVIPSLLGKALALNRHRLSPSTPRSLTQDLATGLGRLRTPAGAIVLLVVTGSTCAWLYLTRPVPPRLTSDDLRYTLGGVCAGMTRAQVLTRAGAGVPQTPVAPGQDPSSFEYAWGELSYLEDGWVALARGVPLLEGEVAVASEGDTPEQVIRALGLPARSERFYRTLRLIWPRHNLSIQFLDGRLQHCALHLRQQGQGE